MLQPEDVLVALAWGLVIGGVIGAALVYVLRPSPQPSTKTQALAEIIISGTQPFHSDKTGGTIYAVSSDDALLIASLVLYCAPQWNLEPACVLAGIMGESLGCASALNPNFQDGKPGETADETFHHTDIGIAQFDGATLLAADFPFSDLKGLTTDQVRKRALDPTWAVPRFCAFVAQLFSVTKEEVAKYPSFLDTVPNKDVRVMATESYNSGLHGAELLAQHNGDWSYGIGWVKRWDSYAAKLRPPR